MKSTKKADGAGSNKVWVGVVGYCPPTRFDEAKAAEMIRDAYGKVAAQWPDGEIAVVSGMTDVGVLKIAYDEAARRGWMTIGVACSRAREHKLFPVDREIWAGSEWGDESPTFVEVIDAIIRIGEGKQSMAETALVKAKGLPAFEYELPRM